MDGGGVCRDRSETRWECHGLSDFGMGRHADKRHVLRARPSESHRLRGRPVSHRLRGETQERHGPRPLEGMAGQIRQLDKQEGSDTPLQVRQHERDASHSHQRPDARIYHQHQCRFQSETRRTASFEGRQTMVRDHACPIDGEPSQNQGIDGSIETLLQGHVVYGGFEGVESQRTFLGFFSHSRSDASAVHRRRV